MASDTRRDEIEAKKETSLSASYRLQLGTARSHSLDNCSRALVYSTTSLATSFYRDYTAQGCLHPVNAQPVDSFDWPAFTFLSSSAAYRLLIFC